MKQRMKKIQNFFKAETVLCISGLAAIITMFFVPPSLDYIHYLDLRVLGLLFCLMVVVVGLNETGLFLLLANSLLFKVKNTRSLSAVLILLCFFSSMWVTNDVALITFVPFTIMLLTMTGQMKSLITIVVLQTIAANLGSMLTPVGNPQNLYLYSTYNILMGEFLLITLPYTVASLLLLLVSVFTIKKEALRFEISEQYTKKNKNNKYTILLYSVLFLASLASVLRLIDYRILVLLVLTTILLFDRKVLRKVDYSLLFTFVFFFLFVGNIGKITTFKLFLETLLAGKEFWVSLGVSQIISNVPAAVLLSTFTEDYKALILGTDLGGLGTLVASLASLISFKFYVKTEQARPGRFLAVFTLYNVFFLFILCLLYLLLNYVGL